MAKKVLLNAFTRALRDGFPPARVAGLKAIVATARYHGPEDAATRVLPAVGPLCVDPVHEVRASALACVQHFSKVLQENHERLEAQAAALAAEGGAAAAAAAPGGAPGGTSLLNSFGWAVSGLGLGGRGGAADSGKPGPAAAAAAPAAAPAVPPPAQPAPAARAPAPAAPVASNGWEEDEAGWEDMDGDAGEPGCCDGVSGSLLPRFSLHAAALRLLLRPPLLDSTNSCLTGLF